MCLWGWHMHCVICGLTAARGPVYKEWEPWNSKTDTEFQWRIGQSGVQNFFIKTLPALVAESASYVEFRVAHAPGMPGMFSRLRGLATPTCISGMHHGTCVTHVPWCMPGSLTSGFLWIPWRENVPDIPGAYTTRNFTYYISGKRPTDSPNKGPITSKRFSCKIQ